MTSYFNIDNFTNNVDKYGLASTNKFQVDMQVPKILQAGLLNGPANPIVTTFMDSAKGMIRTRANMVILPTTEMLLAKTNHYGPGRYITQATNVAFTPIQVEFIADAEGYMEAYFNLWMNSVFNFADSTLNAVTPSFYVNYRDDVKATINIYKYDDGGVLINTYTIVNAFPAAIQGAPLSWDHQNHKLKFTVAFSFTGYAID